MIGNLKTITLAALIAGMATTFLVKEAGIDLYPPSWSASDGRWGYHDPAGVRFCIGARALAALADTSSQRAWSDCHATLAAGNSLLAFDMRYWALIASSAFTLLAAFGFALAVRFDRPPHRVLRGRRLLAGPNARRGFIKSATAEISQSGAGLEFLPGLTISRERETRHWLIWGSVGAGKTQTMLRLILAAIRRGDGVLVLDVKGDMTASLPGDPFLIAPQDQRSMIWDVARDCRTKQDARELAARMIPDSHDPMWADAARDVLVVCVATLQATKGERWTWNDLHEMATASAETLLTMASKHHVDSVRLLQSPDSKTTQSVLSTFQAHMHVVAALAEAWRDDGNGRFSVSDWLQSPTPFRPVILQHDPRYPGLSNIWIGGMLALLASAVGSPSLRESNERRIWIFADEFPQLPRLGNFSTFLDLGRSKGVIAVICAQDLAQLRATYGRERADAWVGMIGTKIITRINAGRGAEEASQLIGDQEIEREERSESYANGQTNVTTARRREIRRVITADEIATRLGPRAKDIRVLMLGQGNDALELSVPYMSLPTLRPSHIPATWSQQQAGVAKINPNQALNGRHVRALSKDAADRIRDLGD